jgi:hypothetical protein
MNDKRFSGLCTQPGRKAASHQRCAVPLLIFTVILSFCINPYISGLSLEDLTGAEQAKALLAGEKPVLVQFDNIQPKLAPRHAELGTLLAALGQDLGPSVMVETLHIY